MAMTAMAASAGGFARSPAVGASAPTGLAFLGGASGFRVEGERIGVELESAEKVKSGEGGASYPRSIETRPLRAICDNLREEASATTLAEAGPDGSPGGAGAPREAVALAVDKAVRDARMDGWRDNPVKERRIQKAIRDALGPFRGQVNTLFQVVRNQSEY